MGTCLGCGASWSGFGAYCNMCKISGLIEKSNRIAEGEPKVNWSSEAKIKALKLYAYIFAVIVFLIIVFPDWGISKLFKFIFKLWWAIIYSVVSTAFDILSGLLRILF